jgi:hypothetical protein
MSWIAAAVVGSAVVGGVVQSKAANKAADAQTQSAQAGIAEQNRQFDAMQALLQPYVGAGTTALGQQAALIGVGGQQAQADAIAALQQGPEFAALTQQGENAILQNASATGGLRGGNTQAALAQFRPQVLSSLIEQQYNRLGGLSSMGQNAAAGVGNAGMQTGNNISNLLQQQGAAQAGGALATGQAWGNVLGSIGQYAGGVSSGAFANPFAPSPFAPTTSIRPKASPF